MTDVTLPPANEAWGFHGTVKHHAGPAQAWPIAFAAISHATGCSDTGIRAFLDSRHGRHFADDVLNDLHAGVSLQQAFDAAIDRWMRWTIDRRTSWTTGISVGLPYLVGFVTAAEIMAETLADSSHPVALIVADARVAKPRSNASAAKLIEP
jgi:hypothetical protein